MKKAILLTGVLLALTVSLASAQSGVNLAWNTCRPAGGLATRGTPADCGENAALFNLVASFKPGVAYDRFIGLSAQLDLASTTPTLPDWWKLAGAQCRDHFAASATGPANLAGANATFCPSPWAIASTPPDPPNQNNLIADWQSEGTVGSGRARLRVGAARTTKASLTDREYYAFRATITDENTSLCTGCDVGVCLRLDNVQLSKADPPSDQLLNSPLVAQHVTWQTTPPTFCPDATPTRRASWGQIKDLYR